MATVRKRNGKFQVQVRLKGLPSFTRTFETKIEAIKWALDIESGKSDSNDPSVVKRRNDITFGEILERYYNDIALQRVWHRRERSIIRNYKKSPLYNSKIEDIDESAVAQYRDNRLKTVRPSTIVRELAAASHCITIAQSDWGIKIPTNPFKLVRKPKVRNGRERRITDDEWRRLVKADSERGTRSFIHIVEFAIETAMRKGELLRTRWIDLNLQQSTLHIEMTKNGYARTIPLTPRALSILESIKIRKDTPCIFNIKYGTLSSWWTELLQCAGVRNCRWHDLRHEGISRHFEHGLSIPEVALISGHRDYSMLKRYTHIRPENVAAKLARLSTQSQ
ncbi:site-specific integrase [Methylobacterium sp. J-026]|uniref:tyrosine-type recombinase/integrase n=1 Tax=Methylobacterium sp. J-026 TaxID=2836624 RepID=UPI001FBA4356|nr:site-specific integrase [Methylobacterium sp. J-026]MCJ2135172.1 site-specific integrase [Methylobacterium sp. J-026]